MSKFRFAVALVAWMVGVAALAPGLGAQTPQKPSPYTGVSQPPPDDTITSDEATVPAPSPKPAAVPAHPVPPPPSMAPAPPPPPAAAALLRRPCNPDDRMIGDPDPCGPPVAPSANSRSAADPDADMVASAPPNAGELPEGTILKIAVDQEISTAETQVGSDFSGRISTDVLSEGRVVIPQGAQVVGKVVQVRVGRRFGAPATIRLRPDVVVLPDGSRYVLRAQVIQTSGRSRVDDEGALKPASRVKTDVLKETAGIGTGAVAGAIIGGGPGALVGSLIGAGVMTTNILVQHPASVTVPKDSVLTLSLTRPMSITPEVASAAPTGAN